MVMAKSSKKANDIADVEQLIDRWARKSFEMTKTKEQSRIGREFLQFNISWKHVKFCNAAPDYSLVPQGGKKTGSKAVMPPQVLFRTVFTNETEQEQEYSFKTERTTRSAATVAIEQGVTRGGEFGISLKTPCEVVEAGAGFRKEITVNNFDEDTVEEDVTWAIDSTVKVPRRSETVAELVIEEAQCEGAFTMKTSFSGRVVVSVTNLKENNELVTVIEGQLSDIVQNELANGLKGFKVEGRSVVVETKGTCKFKYGVEQRVNLKNHSLGLKD